MVCTGMRRVVDNYTVCVCLYFCMYVCVCVYVCACTFKLRMFCHVDTEHSTYMYACMHVCMCVYVYVWEWFVMVIQSTPLICMHACMYVCICICV